MQKLSKRHRDILRELERLGGQATIRQIATALDLPVNGVSQSLNALTIKGGGYVDIVGGEGGDRAYKLLRR